MTNRTPDYDARKAEVRRLLAEKEAEFNKTKYGYDD
jgi:hypothetical protein